MDMGMGGQLPPPGVKHPEKSRQITADKPCRGSQRLECLRRSAKQCTIGLSLVASDSAPELLGYGKGDHEVVPGNLPLQVRLKPLPALMVLTHRTVAIATGAEHSVQCAAAFTLIDDQPTG